MSDSFAGILKIFLTYLLKQIDQNQQEKVLLIILFCVIIIISIGCLIGWILAKRKLKIEISKLNAESKKRLWKTMKNCRDTEKPILIRQYLLKWQHRKLHKISKVMMLAH